MRTSDLGGILFLTLDENEFTSKGLEILMKAISGLKDLKFLDLILDKNNLQPKDCEIIGAEF